MRGARFSFTELALAVCVALAGCTCEPDRTTVVIEAAGSGAVTCAQRDVHGASLVAASAAHDDGVELVVDFCPATGTCRCTITLTHVGSDVAAAVVPETDLVATVVLRSTHDEGTFVALARADGSTVFAGGNGFGHAGTGVGVGMGAAFCPRGDACDATGAYRIRFTSALGDVELAHGESAVLGPQHVRAISDARDGSSCSSGGSGPDGAWVVW